MLVEQINIESSSPSLLQGIAAILAAVAWPIVVLLIAFWNRVALAETFKILVQKISKANKITVAKLLELEEKVDSELAVETAKTPKAISAGTPPADVATDERQAAERVLTRLTEISPNRTQSAIAVRSRMMGFAKEYETIRRSMPSSPERTWSMNNVVAKMRTISLAAKPLLSKFALSDSPGKRLAAITILQMSPNASYTDWLADRMSSEDPFIFFHAAIALRETVRAKGERFPARLFKALKRAKSTVESFNGVPDANTIVVLNQALSELSEITK